MANKFGIIYIATSPSGKSYIGQTVQALCNRKTGHAKDAENYTYAFANAIRKYGINGFNWDTLYYDIPR